MEITISLRASSTLFRAANSFFFPVVRDNLQCIYRSDKDPSGKSFCSWIERAPGAHSLFPETQQTPSSRKCPFFHCWRKLFGPCKFHPGSTSWCFQLRLRSWCGAEELQEEHPPCFLNHSTLCLGKLYHRGLGSALVPEHSPSTARPPWQSNVVLSHGSSCAFPCLLLGIAVFHRSVPALIDRVSDPYCTHPKSISFSGISWKRQRCMKLPCWLF